TLDALDCALNGQPFHCNILLSFKDDVVEFNRYGESNISKFAFAFAILMEEMGGSMIGSGKTRPTATAVSAAVKPKETAHALQDAQSGPSTSVKDTVDAHSTQNLKDLLDTIFTKSTDQPAVTNPVAMRRRPVVQKMLSDAGLPISNEKLISLDRSEYVVFLKSLTNEVQREAANAIRREASYLRSKIMKTSIKNAEEATTHKPTPAVAPTVPAPKAANTALSALMLHAFPAGTLCPYCKTVVKDTIALMKHVETSHPTMLNSQALIYACDVCVFKGARTNQIMQHWKESKCCASRQLRIDYALARKALRLSLAATIRREEDMQQRAAVPAAAAAKRPRESGSDDRLGRVKRSTIKPNHP
ncbi:hypothetical protein PFISCL1PPCAC_4431, partial [Pristionchus fissidentatus]